MYNLSALIIAGKNKDLIINLANKNKGKAVSRKYSVDL